MDKLKPAAIFKNKMVLQRNKEILIWGQGKESSVVTAKINDKEYSSVVTNTDWCIRIPPMEAGGPYILKITDNETEFTYEDVMTGEVWFACGQSNMEFILRNCPDYHDVKEEIKNNQDLDIRYYETPKQSYFSDNFGENEENSGWSKLEDDNFDSWSAVAFYAAKKLAQNLSGITVGIAACFWGGTSASCWCDEDTLLSDLALNEYLTDYQSQIGNKSDELLKNEYLEYKSQLRQWEAAQAELLRKSPDLTWSQIAEKIGPYKWCPPLGPYSQYRPNGLFHTMFSRMYRFSKRGIWYYQGESDDHKPRLYYRLFTRLIECWRTLCEDDSLPFIFVQLPMYSEPGRENETSWAYIREAQQRVYTTVKNTAMTVALDLGEHFNIHPPVKSVLGSRLADQTLALCYGHSDKSGPLYKSSFTQGSEMTVEFYNSSDGFEVRGDYISGFELASYDKKFYKASAVIDNDRIRLTSENVAQPVYLRYNFVNYADVTLYGKNGIPAAPFRTSLTDE
ncbi:MAG: sialate O-acetylesterase [Oscillospiraceae bacterium]|nr:sialate O-acetylesterase [Oscillospiraceae bacterium]